VCHQSAMSPQPGAASEPPNCCTARAAQALAKASRSASGQPERVPRTMAAPNTSPAPVGSSASTFSAGTYASSPVLESTASEPSALTVAATNKTDKRANFSNFGTCVDLFAPGVNITAGWIGSNTATASVSGTSMSSPHVAGVAGLYLEAHPTDTPAQVSAAIVNNATLNKVTTPGAGSPNKLLYMGFLNTGPGNQPPVANFTYSCVAATHTCTLDSSTSTDDVGIVSRQWKRPNGQVLGSGVTLTQAFPAAGTFNITLTVTDGGALSNSKTIGVVVP